MDMGFTTRARLDALVGKRDHGVVDWHGLHARLAAAYAARPGIAGLAPDRATPGGGSFDRRSAVLIARYAERLRARLDAVNPTVSGNGKSVRDKDWDVAGLSVAGDRG